MNRIKQFSWIFCLLIAAGYPVQAQTFRYSATLDSVTASGFYSIAVTPALSARIKPDFSDFRIKDAAGKPVPYLLQSQLSELHEDRYRPMMIRSNTFDDSGNNVVIIEKLPGERTDGFRLVFENAAVSRTIDLSGANDTVRWFSILENAGLAQRFVQDSDRFSEQLSFPLSSFRYFRAVIRNRRNDPLKVLKAEKPVGSFTTATAEPVFNPPLLFVSRDSNRSSTISISNPLHYHIGFVMLRVISPRFFRRTITCFAGQREIKHVLVRSDSLLQLTLPLLNDSLIRIQIFNEDNPPLVVASVITGQYEDKILTYLEKNKSYHLEMTSDQASLPDYDLVHFKDSIPASVPPLAFAAIQSLQTASPAKVKEDQNGWLWPCLVFVIIVLGLSAYRLARDVAEKNAS